jgi:hypothetical protein
VQFRTIKTTNDIFIVLNGFSHKNHELFIKILRLNETTNLFEELKHLTLSQNFQSDEKCFNSYFASYFFVGHTLVYAEVVSTDETGDEIWIKAINLDDPDGEEQKLQKVDFVKVKAFSVMFPQKLDDQVISKESKETKNVPFLVFEMAKGGSET